MMKFRRYRKYFLCFILAIAFAVTASAGNSVLSSGTWYKMSLTTTGMYKITYSELVDMGVDVAHIDPRNIRIFHNGGGVLPKVNNVPCPDDLVEIPIYVYGESDGVFNQNDYILFYAR